MNGTLNALQVIGFDVIGTFQNKPLSIPNEFGIAIMTSDMHMDRLVFVGEKQENKTVLSK